MAFESAEGHEEEDACVDACLDELACLIQGEDGEHFDA